MAKGTYVPGSDADIVVVLKEDKRRIIDRIPEFARPFLHASVPTDLFPYTRREIEDQISGGNLFVRALWNEKIVLAERDPDALYRPV